MSYILDALRRADAERERGAVPGLSSQQHAYVEDDAAKPQRSRILVWAVVALAAALVVAVAWNFIGGGSASPPPRPVVEGSVSPAPPVVTPSTTPSPALQTPPPATTPPPSPATTAQTPPSGPAIESTTAAPTTPAHPSRAAAKHSPEPKRVARRNAEPEPTPAPANATAANTAPAKAEPKAAEPKTATARTPSEGRVYQQAELPDDVRRDLPKLVIGGASYSGDPASRMVMINGQIFHEGDQLAPQLVLERIKLKSAVLSYKGYRYELTF